MELNLTPIQERLFEVLKDGEPHDPSELIPLIDELADKAALQDHLYQLRIKLRRYNREVIAQSFGRRIAYRYVQLLTTKDLMSS